MKRIGRFFLAGLVIAPLLLMSPTAPARPQAAEAAPHAVGGIVLVARDLVDINWDPAQYPQPQQKFLRWELYRGPSEAGLVSLTMGASAATDFYRDTGLASGQTHYYQLQIVRCVDPCAGVSDERSYTIFTDSVTSGVFQGTVHRDLTLDSGVYQIGFGGVGSSAAVTVISSTLTIGSGATVQDGGLSAVGGYLNVDSATLKDVSLRFGDYYDEDSWGGGWVDDAIIENGTVSVYGVSDVRIQGNSGDFSINVSQAARATIEDNTMTGGIDVNHNASATIEDNEITTGNINVSGYGTSTSPKASALVVGNTITSPHQHFGVDVSYGASVEVTDNHIEWTGFHGSESSVLIMASDEGTSLIAERNTIVSGKIGVFWGADITLTDNVIRDGGAAITIGCIVCGSGTQATGTIERNTVQNGWGFEMWAGSDQLTVKHNCIRGNDPGLTTDAYLQNKLDMTYNWWNHISGPYHPSLNADGNGDAIEGNQVLFDPWDKSDIYCADIPPPPPFIDVKGRVYVPGSEYPLIGVPVTLLRQGNVLAQATTEPPYGEYNLNRVPITDSLVISVTLEYVATTPSVFRVLYEQPTGPVGYVATLPFATTGPGDLSRNIRFANVADLDPGGLIAAGDRDDLGMIYYHTHQAWQLVDEVVNQPLDLMLPVDIIGFSTFDPVTFWVGPSSDGSGAAVDPFINIGAAGSQITSGDRPDNREWHEFGHHVHADTFGDLFPANPADGNHGGYSNPSTTDSWTEGFAEFFSMLVARWIEADPQPEQYRWGGSSSNLESNYLAWNFPEEFAAAGLLWDLVDQVDADDASPIGPAGTTYADCVEMSLESFWTLFETDWGEAVPKSAAAPANYGYLFDVKHLYDVLKLQGVGSAHSRGRETDDLDELFIAHGFFADLNPPYQEYGPGEEVGRAANMTVTLSSGVVILPRPDRRNRPPLAGSYIAFEGREVETGAEVNIQNFTVAVRFAPPFEHFSYSFQQNTAQTPGRLFFFGPDPQYEATTYITATAPGYVSAAPLIVTNAFYWAQLATDPADSFLEHTYEMEEAPTIYLPVVVGGSGGLHLGTAPLVTSSQSQALTRVGRPCVPETPTPTPTPSAPIVDSIDPTSASSTVDVEVTIYGYFFQSGASPSIGSMLLQDVEYLEPETAPPTRSRIRATLPAGLDPGTYDVTVVNPDGQAGVLDDGFTVTGVVALCPRTRRTTQDG